MKELFESSYLSVMSEENDKLRKEIERLKQDNEYLNKVNIELSSEKNRLHSIIKEVREYIKENKIYAELVDYEKNGEYYIDEIGLLEILDKIDKENNNEDNRFIK